jgi:hypothetical protein
MVGARHWHEFVVEGKRDAARAGQRADQTWIVRLKGASGYERAKGAPDCAASSDETACAESFQARQKLMAKT